MSEFERNVRYLLKFYANELEARWHVQGFDVPEQTKEIIEYFKDLK